MSDLKERLVSARRSAGLTQQALADAIGLRQSSYADIETGKIKSTTKLPQIAKVLGVDAYWLATGKGARNTPASDPRLSAILEFFDTLDDKGKEFLVRQAEEIARMFPSE